MVLRRAILILIVCLFAQRAFTQLDCNDKQIAQLVGSLGKTGKAVSDSEKQILSQRPQQSVCYLIRELHVISAKTIPFKDLGSDESAVHVIWCIRMIRYLTNSQIEFTAQTHYKFKSWEDERQSFLIDTTSKESKFFAVWMSRMTTYIAPEDAQRKIIRKWVDWYGKNGATYTYIPDENFDDWYW